MRAPALSDRHQRDLVAKDLKLTCPAQMALGQLGSDQNEGLLSSAVSVIGLPLGMLAEHGMEMT